MTQQKLAMIPVADLTVGDNVREDPGDIDSLVESIRLLGILEPLVVWPSEDGTRAEVGMGQRRFNAARIAGLTEVPCVLRARPDERDRVLMQLAENHERADMSPIDEAHAFRDLQKMGISRRAIARSLRKTEDWVYKRQRLLDYPKPIRDAVHVGTLSPYIALEFPLSLSKDKDAIKRLPKGPGQGAGEGRGTPDGGVDRPGDRGVRSPVTDVLDQALAYAARGWHVLPLHEDRW